MLIYYISWILDFIFVRINKNYFVICLCEVILRLNSVRLNNFRVVGVDIVVNLLVFLFVYILLLNWVFVVKKILWSVLLLKIFIMLLLLLMIFRYVLMLLDLKLFLLNLNEEKLKLVYSVLFCVFVNLV